MRYTEEDKICAHCGGEISPHSVGNGVKFWCDNCGSNNKDEPPSVIVEYSKE